MGVVWRGQDLETGAWVAIKLLRPDYASSAAAVSRFVGERNALVRFRHQNVVNLRDMIVEGDRLALVMDLITGGDLDTFRNLPDQILIGTVLAKRLQVEPKDSVVIQPSGTGGEQRRYTDRVERDGLAMTFTSMHRPLGVYTAALFANGMVITALTEGGDGTVPWLLALRADKLAR